MNQRRARAHLPDHGNGVFATNLHPISINLQTHALVQFFQHDIDRGGAVNLFVLPPMIVIVQAQIVGAGELTGLIQPFASSLDGIDRLKVLRRQHSNGDAFEIEGLGDFKHGLLVGLIREGRVAVEGLQIQLAEERRRLGQIAWHPGVRFNADVAQVGDSPHRAFEIFPEQFAHGIKLKRYRFQFRHGSSLSALDIFAPRIVTNLTRNSSADHKSDIIFKLRYLLVVN